VKKFSSLDGWGKGNGWGENEFLKGQRRGYFEKLLFETDGSYNKKTNKSRKKRISSTSLCRPKDLKDKRKPDRRFETVSFSRFTQKK